GRCLNLDCNRFCLLCALTGTRQLLVTEIPVQRTPVSTAHLLQQWESTRCRTIFLVSEPSSEVPIRAGHRADVVVEDALVSKPSVLDPIEQVQASLAIWSGEHGEPGYKGQEPPCSA